MFKKLFSDRGLSLDRLRVLVEIHQAGGIAQAAPGDPVRQSQYSRQLRELSEFFGVEVARRQGRQLKLTPQGVQLVELVRVQLQALEDFRAQCHGESVSFMVASGDSLIHWLVIPRLAAVMARAGGPHFATSNLRTNEIVQQLNDGRVDFGVIRTDAVASPLKQEALGTLHFAAVVPRALAPKRGELSLRDVLGGLPFATHTSDEQFTQKLRVVAEKLGCTLRPALTCQSFPQSLAAVRSGGFAAIVPTLALQELPANTFVEVRDPTLAQLDRKLALAWNSRLPRIRPAAKPLMELLAQALKL